MSEPVSESDFKERVKLAKGYRDQLPQGYKEFKALNEYYHRKIRKWESSLEKTEAELKDQTLGFGRSKIISEKQEVDRMKSRLKKQAKKEDKKKLLDSEEESKPEIKKKRLLSSSEDSLDEKKKGKKWILRFISDDDD